MIASVVATLEKPHDAEAVLAQISQLPGVEIGEVSHHARRIPLILDSSHPHALEETTRQLQAIGGIAFVDVVFVHFEEAAENSSSA